MENINSWNDIQWNNIEKKVFRLQLSIFKAAANYQLEKMYKLQKFLTSSKSAKYLSVRRVTQDNAGKNIPGIDNILVSNPHERFALANQLTLDGKSSSIRIIYLCYSDGKYRQFGIPTIKDRAKQMLAYLALSPQWEVQFEANSYSCSCGFRPDKSTLDAIEAIFLGIYKKPKWVLNTDISKCFDEINHQYLIEKCNTYLEMRKQIQVWLKVGILEGEQYTFSEMGTPHGEVISPLLTNIALNGLRENLNKYINTLRGNRSKNQQALTYVRYVDDLVIMYPDRETLEHLKEVVQQFLKPIGLKLHPIKTRIVHTLETTDETPSGFTFLGFDIIQKQKRRKQCKTFSKVESKQDFITLITPSKEEIKKHKSKVRGTIRRYRGASQERLIQVLNPIIRGWALSKCSQVASKIFQDLDSYLWIHLWKWARKRHPKMSKVKLKDKYWHQVGKKNWVFGDKKNGKSIIQLHSKISIKRHVKLKGNVSPFNKNLIYWAKRTGKSILISPNKAKLIQLQNSHYEICGNYFLTDDIIKCDHIVSKDVGGKNILENLDAFHPDCHLKKTKTEMLEIRRKLK